MAGNIKVVAVTRIEGRKGGKKFVIDSGTKFSVTAKDLEELGAAVKREKEVEAESAPKKSGKKDPGAGSGQGEGTGEGGGSGEGEGSGEGSGDETGA